MLTNKSSEDEAQPKCSLNKEIKAKARSNSFLNHKITIKHK